MSHKRGIDTFMAHRLWTIDTPSLNSKSDCQSNKQNFPFRTLAMLVSLGSCLLGSLIFTDPHPLSPDNEETPFYRKGKTPLGTNCQSPNQEVQIVDKMRLEGIILKMIQIRISLLWVFKFILIR